MVEYRHSTNTTSERTININNVEVSEFIHGTGPNHILALHGWTKEGKNTILPALKYLSSDKYTIHIPDLPGFGSSQNLIDTWSVERYSNFVIDYLQRQNYFQAVNIIGHSFGGRISLKLATDHPDMINKMILINSAGIPNKVSYKNQIRFKTYRIARKILNFSNSGASQNLRDWYNNRYASDDYKNCNENMKPTFINVIKEDASKYANKILCPTLLLWGSEDENTPVWQAKELQRLIPNSGLFVWQGAGHYSHLERPDGTCKAIDLFLSQD